MGRRTVLKLEPAARISLGVISVIFGADFFLHFLPEQPISDRGAAFLEALLKTGYLFPLIKAIEIGAGLMLLAGRGTPLALALLAPIALNIALYHVALDPNGRVIGLTAVLLECVLLAAHR